MIHRPFQFDRNLKTPISELSIEALSAIARNFAAVGGRLPWLVLPLEVPE